MRIIGCVLTINKAINKITVKYRFPIHMIDDLINDLTRAVILTKIDLRSGYHQIMINKGERQHSRLNKCPLAYQMLQSLLCVYDSNPSTSFWSMCGSIFWWYTCVWKKPQESSRSFEIGFGGAELEFSEAEHDEVHIHLFRITVFGISDSETKYHDGPKSMF